MLHQIYGIEYANFLNDINNILEINSIEQLDVL